MRHGLAGDREVEGLRLQLYSSLWLLLGIYSCHMGCRLRGHGHGCESVCTAQRGFPRCAPGCWAVWPAPCMTNMSSWTRMYG